MLLRNAREVGALIADGRRRLRWSQFELARRAGVSRQWVSQVENGKTTVEFDLVLAALHALDYALYVQSKDLVSFICERGEASRASPEERVHLDAGRTMNRGHDPVTP